MTTRRFQLLLDSLMLVTFAALMSWRLTGVPLHEWLAVALLTALVVHLVVQWRWIESRLALALRGGTGRTRINVTLNLSLFVAMGVAMVSGFVISKALVPNALAPRRWVTWHGLHDGASTATLVILGLHLALNWELVVAWLRRSPRRTGVVAADGSGPPGRKLRVGPITRRLAWISAAAAVLALTTWAVGSRLPGGTVGHVYPDGHVAIEEPPREVTLLDPRAAQPDPARGGARFVARLAMLGVVAVAGRRGLRLRLA